jgi:hypothetical protein
MTENNELLKSPKQTKEILVLSLTKAKANEIHWKWIKSKYYKMLYYEILLYFVKFH